MDKPNQLSEKKKEPEPPAKSGEAKAADGEKVAWEPSAKTGEAKLAVGEKLVSKPQAKSGEAKPAVGEKVAWEPPAKLEKPSQLSERNLFQNHQQNVEKPN